jgi:hypothetical protein
MDILVKVCQERLEGANTPMQPDMSLTREKYQMMMLILSKIRERTGELRNSLFGQVLEDFVKDVG